MKLFSHYFTLLHCTWMSECLTGDASRFKRRGPSLRLWSTRHRASAQWSYSVKRIRTWTKSLSLSTTPPSLTPLFLSTVLPPPHLFHFVTLAHTHYRSARTHTHNEMLFSSAECPNNIPPFSPSSDPSLVLMHWVGLCTKAMRRAVSPLHWAMCRWPMSVWLTVLNISSFTW